jgi:hypothetical protein
VRWQGRFPHCDLADHSLAADAAHRNGPVGNARSTLNEGEALAVQVPRSTELAVFKLDYPSSPLKNKSDTS